MFLFAYLDPSFKISNGCLTLSLSQQVKDYILQLEAHLVETHRQAQRLIKRQGELGSSLGDFGSSLLGLGKFEQSPLADQFIAMGENSSNLATMSKVLEIGKYVWKRGHGWYDMVLNRRSRICLYRGSLVLRVQPEDLLLLKSRGPRSGV